MIIPPKKDGWMLQSDLPAATGGQASPYFAGAPANDNARRGDWLQCFSGGKFYPLDPRADEMNILDIAHSLSLQCRYAGHCLRFYSVAEHSVLLARYVAPEHRLWALLHDASEAYLVDVPRPIKGDLAGYREIEARIMGVVSETFGLRGDMPAAVHDADIRICVDEKAQNMAAGPMWGIDGLETLGVKLQFWSPAEAEAAFLDMFADIKRGM